MKLLELREMIKLVSKSSIQEFNLTNKGGRISLKKLHPMVLEAEMDPQETFQTALNEAAVTVADEKQAALPAEPNSKEVEKAPSSHQIVSPFIGVFSFSNKPFIKAGDRVTEGSLVGSCNVEALGLTHEILSDVNGEITEVLVEGGEIVEYGQPLFLVKSV
ncbi:biotin/lipoyl-containing protein [Neobacillus kokaensis]|uniref:Acetyl-CoA carboxylase, biotin carboxyl carrier protein n=1 Tax=Neobacillus kokaensis TaxID=2759023 RepID=A0ABQ3MXU8_9BACI|nr:biotin/lipoyl-containing protein [Neobacillus kokaensis]GHH97493.1 acetyl-CoA carboxylase, biotin carboxyl carrier protein [Neobacillus kokaensis]